MIITDTILLSTGRTAFNVYCEIVPHMNTIAVDGKIPCDLIFYYSEKDKDDGYDPIYPLDANGKKITHVILQISSFDILKSEPNCTWNDVFNAIYEICAKKNGRVVWMEKYKLFNIW
jgi:hypothetical protein